MVIEYIYIVLTNTGTLFTKTIKQYTKAPYNHSSLAFDPELKEMYSFGRKNPKNPFNGGFVKEDVYNGVYKEFPKTTCAIYKLEVTKRDIQKIRRIISVFKKNKNKLFYNLPGIIGVALNEPLEPINSYFCSQFVSEVLYRAKIISWDKPTSLVTPDDFRNFNKLTLIYEGKLFDYEPIKKYL